MAGGKSRRSLEQTPTWAVAVVCFVLVLVSLIIEYLIHLVGKFLKRRHKRALFEALEKIKSELMLLGFISLLLTVGQGPISEICVPRSVGDSWHPCRRSTGASPSTGLDGRNSPAKFASAGSARGDGAPVSRRLLQDVDANVATFRRALAGAGGGDKCARENKVSLISASGIHQLHIFIFVLAVFHVLYCITTLALGRLKMRHWRVWEQETHTMEYKFSSDPERFRIARETSFGRRHLSFWSRSPVLIWIVCFFRQFFGSVHKVDYLTLRHGFIMAHLAPHSTAKFDFRSYIKRSLEEDFKVVVGINPVIWFFAVLFLLFNTHGWYSYFWLPFIPLVVILLVGTKLQVVITRMATQIMDRDDIVKGVPRVQPTDDLFWFRRPKLLLYLIHFVLFQNAFQLAFFAWSWSEYGISSCFHEHNADKGIRLSMGILIQVLCSYVTLPLYALVTQMGSNMRPTIFNERVAAALRRWHRTARKHVKESHKYSGRGTPSPSSQPPTPPLGFSPVHLLRYYRGRNEPSPRLHNDDTDLSTTCPSPADGGSSSNKYVSRGKEVGQAEAAEAPGGAAPAAPEDHRIDLSGEFSFDKREGKLDGYGGQ